MKDMQPRLPAESVELRRDRRWIALAVLALAAIAALLAHRFHPFRGPAVLLHVSYDASREFYAALNAAYAKEIAHGAEGSSSRIVMSHAGSTRQASNLAHGQVADLVSLASEFDLDAILAGNQCVIDDWREQFPSGSSPFFSSIAIVTRAGNPKSIRDWPDLWRNDVTLVLPSPARSGAGRWAFLALYAEARAASDDDRAAQRHLQNVFLKSVALEGGARHALLQFAHASDADALLTWESDALRLAELGVPELQAVFPSRSLRAEPRVAVLTCHAESRSTAPAARGYLLFHYSPIAQKLAAAAGLRPREAAAAARAGRQFPATQLVSLAEAFPGEPDVWSRTFGEDGLFARMESLRNAYRSGGE